MSDPEIFQLGEELKALRMRTPYKDLTEASKAELRAFLDDWLQEVEDKLLEDEERQETFSEQLDREKAEDWAKGYYDDEELIAEGGR